MKTTLAILFLATLAPLLAACGLGPAARPEAVHQTATPRGWVAVDYGTAQISVPADWVRGACPASPTGTVILGTAGVDCPTHGSNWPAVRIVPFRPPLTTDRPVRINDIKAYPVPYRGHGHDIAIDQVPSLGVEVETNGPLFAKIIATVTRALGHGAPSPTQD